MENIRFLEVINRIKSCLLNNDSYIAKEYLRLEIKNLQELTEKKCENIKYFGTSYCNYCLNENCNENKKGVCFKKNVLGNVFVHSNNTYCNNIYKIFN